MATIQQRGATWRAMVRMRGHRLTATFDTRDDAREWAAKEEARILGGERAAKGSFLTPVDLFRHYATTVSPTKRGARWEIVRLAALSRDPAFSTPLRDFGPAQIAAWRDRRSVQVSSYTVNREMNLISGVFTRAIREWGLGRRDNPVHLVSRPRNPPPRKRRVSDKEILAIRGHLGWDGGTRPATSAQWVAWAHILAVQTAMRRGEILSLTWGRVDLDQASATLTETKNGDARVVPLGRTARALCLLLGGGNPEEKVVPVAPGNFSKLFGDARDAAGLKGLRFHDTRREATTRMAPKLGNALDLAKVTGHRDIRVLERTYYAPAAKDLADKLD